MGFLIGLVLLGFISSLSNLVMSYVFLILCVGVAFSLVVFGLSRKYKDH